ncbi:RraA family protein [Paraburkholderia sp. ZP32-5]|uniref:RraA family protein n=1 Tax=Paraburkholderia sp. ZP32-5 TaxID=2883245 RepID=UPI001F177FBE|nr:RraA family protein [Paraburkholderia sp. ZP32-5]
MDDRTVKAFQERLKKIDTCVLSDALDRLGIKGVAFGMRRLAGSSRVAGRVITVTLGPAEGGVAPRHLCTAAVEQGTDADVIVVEHHSHQQAAGWGGILSLAAKQRGIEGVIVDGQCRDIDEAEDFGFCIFGKGSVPSTARSRVMEVACGEPVVIGGVRVRQGDLVLADGTGIVFIPAARAEEVIVLAEQLAAREQAMMVRIRSGEAVSAVMNHQYEAMLQG